MYKSILVPLDSSSFAEDAVSVAVSIALRAKGNLCLATVEMSPAFVRPGYPTPGPGEAAKEYLAGVAEEVRESSGVGVATEVVVGGNVADGIETLRARVGAGLVVVSTHGHGPMARSWLGSTADEHLRRSQAPVLLIRPRDQGEERDLTKELQVDRILIATDGSVTSEAIFGPALELGQLLEADCHVLRIVEFPHGIPSVYPPDAAADNREQLEAAKAAADQETADLVERLRERGWNVTSSVETHAHVASGVLAAGAEGNFDLIALATHGRGGVRRMVLGSVADKLVRSADVPVLVVRPTED